MENKKEDPLFLPAPFFMSRTALLPITQFFSLFKKGNISQNFVSIFIKDPLLREALAIASPSLYKMVIDNKDSSQVQASLLRYFSRMTARSTPFGLFSSVALGTFFESSSVPFDLSNIHKKARPDMDWLYAVLNLLFTDPNVFPFLSIRKNPLIFESGDRIFLSYFKKVKETDNQKTISIRSSPLIHSIIEIAKHPINVVELLNKIIQQNSLLEKEKVLEIIRQLLMQQFLTFTLTPSLLTNSPFSDLLSKLTLIPHSLFNISAIASILDDYNNTQAGQGEECLQKLQKTMETIVTTQNLLQVDAIYSGREITLSKKITHSLGEAAEIMWRLSIDNHASSQLNSYHEKFLEKYGTYRIVPLLELLNEGTGLGVPENYTKSHSEILSNDRTNHKWKKWLKQQWIHCIQENRHDIYLTDNLIEQLINKKEKANSLLSFDLYCEIIAESSSKVDEGDYQLIITSYAKHGGSTFGRFLNLFGEDAKEKIRIFYLEEESLQADCLFCESSYLPSFSRHANVSIIPNLRRAAIDLGGSGTISLNEIYVGATSGKFFLTLKDRSQELIVKSGNMLNHMLAPIPLRFIRDVSTAKYQQIFFFPWGDLADASFLPRICYKNTILSEARWRVDLHEFGLSAKDKIEILEKKFQEWALRWSLPRYLFLGRGDHRILIDRENQASLQEVIKKIKQGDEVLLFEKVGQEKGQWVQSNLGTHQTEFVIPFIKNAKYSSRNDRQFFPKYYSAEVNERYKLPGCEWLYVKFYLNIDQENRFLVNFCSRFIAFFLQKEIITDWFFVRYADPRPHLRLRLKGNRELILTELIPALHDWIQNLINEQLIQEMTLSSYEREIERYGGAKLIESAEALFHADSTTTILLIQAILSRKTIFDDEIIGALSLIDMLKGIGLDIKQQLEFFASLDIKKEELKGFRQHKSLLLSFGEAVLQNSLENLSPEASVLNEAFLSRREVLNSFATQMIELEKRQELVTPSNLILDSILHMHCNRLLGRERKKEMKAKLYAFHTISILNEKSSRILC